MPTAAEDFLTLFDLIGVLSRRRYQAADRAFSSLGLNHTEARLLVLLQEADGASTQEKLAEQTFIDRTNVGRALDRLEAEGFILRRKDTADRRANRLSMTAQGRKAVVAIHGLRKKMALSFFGELQADDARTIVRALEKSLTADERAHIRNRSRD